MKKLIALIALFMFAAVMSYAAETTQATGQAHAKIVSAAAISHDSTVLDFGTLVKPTSAATVTLDAVATPTPHDSTGLVRAAGGVSSDHFSLSNLEEGMSYTLQIPTSTTVSDGTHSMTVNLTPSASSFTGTAAGTDVLYVGGTLNINANQDAGDYTGTYLVSLTY